MTNIRRHVILYETLCTAYKFTVQTEQTVTIRHGVGSHEVTVEVFPHGTVVANILVSWGFCLRVVVLTPQSYLAIQHKFPAYSECHREI